MDSTDKAIIWTFGLTVGCLTFLCAIVAWSGAHSPSQKPCIAGHCVCVKAAEFTTETKEPQ